MDDNAEFILGESFATILTETTPSLVCVFDREARILLFNDACERATGFRREEVLGRDAREFVIPQEEREAFGDFLANVWRTGAPSPQVGHWRTKDGGRRLIAWSNRPMIGDDGEPATLVTTGIDLTDREPAQGEDRPAGRSGGQARRGLAAGERAAGAPARRDARRRGGQPRPRVHRRLGGVRAGPAGQHVGGAALRRRRHGHGRRPHEPRQHRRLPDRRDDRRRRAPAPSARCSRPARPPASTTGAEHGETEAIPRRLPLVRRGADRRQRRALGRGHDREREPAPARLRDAAGRLRRARLAGGRERAGARGPDRQPRPARLRRRRAAPQARAQPARRRAAAPRRASRSS